MEHKKWASLENFTNMYFGVQKSRDFYAEDAPKEKVIFYNAKIKLHGTNAAISISQDGVIRAQKRSSFCTPEDDNAGFAAWVNGSFRDNLNSAPEDLFHKLLGAVIHGEWCGPGVQKGDACSITPHKFFAVFALEFPSRGEMIVDPGIIYQYIKELVWSDFFILPWYYDTSCKVDLYDKESVDSFLKIVNSSVDDIDEEDYWIRWTFGISGKGEGLVFYNVEGVPDPRLMFKAKTERHMTTKARKPAQVDPEKTGKLVEFARMVVTDARLEQGYLEVSNGERLTMKNVPDFLRWVAGDVQKECVAEMEANGYDWKSIAKSVNGVAVSWFSKRVNEI